MYRQIALASFVLILSLCSPAQNGIEHGWTDKNNTDQYAAYLVSVAYFEHGYMAAKVQFRDDGAKRIFEVNPGPVYHLKALEISGADKLPKEAMNAAPQEGDVYSASRMNDFLSAIGKEYGRSATSETSFDHARAEVTVKLKFDAH